MEALALPQWLFGPFAFVITFAENWVASRERGAERQSKMAKTMRFSMFSANWSSVFEIILLVDIVLTIADPVRILPWVVAGGWLGQFLACERQRRKFQTRKHRRKREAPASISEGTPPVSPRLDGHHVTPA